METHEKLRALRLLCNYKQEYVAEKLGISQQAFAKIEKGRTKLNFEKLEKIAAVYNTRVKILFEGPESI